MKHIESQHKKYLAALEAKEVINTTGSNQSVLSYLTISDKAVDVYGWMPLIIDCNMPFTNVDNPVLVSAVRFKKIAYKTLMKYLRVTKEKVIETIKNELPDSFGLIIDGWTENNMHVLAVFANYSKDGVTQMVLLAVTRLSDPTNQKAPNHVETIKAVLAMYNKDLSNVLFLTADNTNLNPAIAHEMNVPFLGCASHRLSLAVKRRIERSVGAEEIINKVYTDYRRSMKPKSLELILFLKANRKLWSLKTTVPIVSSNADDGSNENVADY